MLEIETATVTPCAPGTREPPCAKDNESLSKPEIGEDATLILGKDLCLKCFSAGASFLRFGMNEEIDIVEQPYDRLLMIS
jgi:hypothetical protein